MTELCVIVCVMRLDPHRPWRPKVMKGFGGTCCATLHAMSSGVARCLARRAQLLCVADVQALAAALHKTAPVTIASHN